MAMTFAELLVDVLKLLAQIGVILGFWVLYLRLTGRKLIIRVEDREQDK